MAINKNHEFEDLDGVKCAIVEKNASADRVAFLRAVLEYNGFTVVAVKSPPPKAAPAKPDAPPAPEAPIPETFTVGVTDVTFNPVNAIFGRLLRTPRGHVVTQAYWLQKEAVSHDDLPYYEWRAEGA